MSQTFGWFISPFGKAFCAQQKFLSLLILAVVCFDSGITHLIRLNRTGNIENIELKIEFNLQFEKNQETRIETNDTNVGFTASNVNFFLKDITVSAIGAEGDCGNVRLPKGEDSDSITRSRRNKIREVSFY